MARVWVYPDREWKQLGEFQFQVQAEIVRPESMGKDEIDIDEDVRSIAWSLPTYEKAAAHAQKVLGRDDLAFGAVYIQKQVVDWFIKEDRIAEWRDVGELEEVTK